MDLYRLVPQPMKKYLSPTFMRYGIMAAIIVTIELVSFWILNSKLSLQYLLATDLSLLIGILLNWVGSRYYVFGASHHSIQKEFMLVFISSLAGVVWQSLTVYIAVSGLNARPLIGKGLAIIVTFFWNYFIRKRHIYKTLAEVELGH